MATWQWYMVMGALVAIVLGIPFMASRLRELELSRAGLGHLREWTDADMLKHVARILGAMGYRVQPAGEEHPQFDLLLTDGLGQHRAVLVRHWRKVIDEAVVKEVVAAAAGLGGAPAMVITIERYTLAARNAARDTETILWTLSDLTRAIGQIRRSAVAFPDLPASPTVVNPPFSMEVLPPQRPNPIQSALQALAPAANTEGKVPMRSRRRPARLRKGEKWSGLDTPFCPRCGKKMVPKEGPDGREFWGCPTFPRCLGSRPR